MHHCHNVVIYCGQWLKRLVSTLCVLEHGNRRRGPLMFQPRRVRGERGSKRSWEVTYKSLTSLLLRLHFCALSPLSSLGKGGGDFLLPTTFLDFFPCLVPYGSTLFCACSVPLATLESDRLVSSQHSLRSRQRMIFTASATPSPRYCLSSILY